MHFWLKNAVETVGDNIYGIEASTIWAGILFGASTIIVSEMGHYNLGK